MTSSFKKELPKWLSATTKSIRPAPALLIRTVSLVRCTAFRLLLLALIIVFVLMNIWATSRGYSTVIDYSKPIPRDVSLQMDILCPLYQRDEALRVFGQELGKAIRSYLGEGSAIGGLGGGGTASKSPRITRFRLLLTRYSAEAQDKETLDSLRKELSALTLVIPEDVVIIRAPKDAVFERAAAVNLLQRNACRRDQCLVARMDADMTVLPEFFHNAVEAVYLNRTAYFPIVWSEYYPLSVQLVERNYTQEDKGPLEERSEHRGYWRKYGTGMYCLSGPHAQRFQLKESFKGWGGEDGDFLKSVRKQLTEHRVTRQEEPGLVHRWHAKFCQMGVDVHNDKQWKDCNGARIGQMGSELGLQLLRDYWKENMPEEYWHHSIVF